MSLSRLAGVPLMPLSFCVSVALHAAVVGGLFLFADSRPAGVQRAPTVITIHMPTPTEHPPPAATAPVADAPFVDRPRRPKRRIRRRSRSTPKAQPAVGKESSVAPGGSTESSPVPAQPLDFTQGSWPVYSAASSSASTSIGSPGSLSVRGTPPAESVDAGSGDLSRGASLRGGRGWRCPFPREADAAGVHHALVRLRVSVDATGRPREAAVLDDPGHGFAGAARRCALAEHYLPAKDRSGAAVGSQTLVNVRFVR